MNEPEKLAKALSQQAQEPSQSSDSCCARGVAQALRLYDIRYNEAGEMVRAERTERNQFFEAVYCECPLGAERRDEDKDLIADMLAPDLPRRYSDMTLDSSPCDLEIRKRLRVGEGSWLLWGPYGTGKTGLAVGHSLAWVDAATEKYFKVSTCYEEPAMPLPEALRLDEMPRRVHFVATPDLLSELRSTYGKTSKRTESDVLAEYRDAHLLIMDDIGAEHVKDSGWLEDRLYQVIGHRHAEEMPTIFTSNLTPDELGAQIGERVMWRIIEMCGKENIVHVDGPNLRAAPGRSE